MRRSSVLKMGAKVYGATTIGPYSMGGGEIKNSVIFGHSNKAHDGYLGDSIIGEWCNLGAGTTNSNVKNTAGDVKLWDNASKSRLSICRWIKCGLMMGDYRPKGRNQYLYGLIQELLLAYVAIFSKVDSLQNIYLILPGEIESMNWKKHWNILTTGKIKGASV